MSMSFISVMIGALVVWKDHFQCQLIISEFTFWLQGKIGFCYLYIYF